MQRRVLALSEVDLEQVTQMNTHQNAGYLRVFRIEEVMLGKQPPPGRYPYRYSAEIEHAVRSLSDFAVFLKI